MPTPVSYLSGASLSNTVGMFKRGTIAQNLKTSLESGYRWWNGVEVTSSQYLIYSDTFTLGTTTQANATPVAYSTPDLTDQSLLNLINTLPPRIGQTAFTSLPIALQWLQSSNKFFLIRGGTENIVKSGLQLYADAGRFDSYIGNGTTWSDLSSNGNNGTLVNGTGYNSSGVGSMVFDGTNDYVSFGNAASLQITNALTVDVWLKANTSGDFITAVAKSNGATGGWTVQLRNLVNEWRFWVNFGVNTLGNGSNNGWYYANFPKTWNDNKWHHFVGIWDGSSKTVKLYIDGIQGTFNAGGNPSGESSSIGNYNGNLVAGSETGGNNPLNGNISSLKVYNIAFSPEQVLQNFNAQKYRFGYYDIVQSGLTFNLDATNYLSYPRSGTTAYDISGYDTKNGTLLNGVNFSGGTVPTFIFDGTDDYIRVSNREDLDFPVANFTAACWFKSTQNSDYIGLLGKIQFGVGTNGWTLEFSNAKVTCWTNSTLIQSPLTYNDGKWHYALMTMGTPSTGQINVYVDGYLVTTAQMHAYTFDPTNLDLWVGGWTNGTSYLLSGEISNAQIYNRVLSPQEVIQNFESQRVNFGTTGITTNGLVLNLDAANTASYGGSGTVWRDISGGGNDGILTNGPTYSNSGASSSIVFDGADDFINLGNTSINIGTGDMSVSIWVKVTAFFGINAFFYSIGSNQSGFYGLGCTLNGTPFFATTPGGQIITLGSAGSITANNWCNLVGTRINGTIRLYLNGSQTGTPVTSSGVFNTTNAKIGTNADASSEKLQGNSSLFMLYNVGLTDSQVLQNYNAQKSRFGL